MILFFFFVFQKIVIVEERKQIIKLFTELPLVAWNASCVFVRRSTWQEVWKAAPSAVAFTV